MYDILFPIILNVTHPLFESTGSPFSGKGVSIEDSDN